MSDMEDTTPKFLDSVTEHPDVQRLIKQVIRSDVKNKQLQAELEKLKEQLLKPCVTCDVFNENAKLKKALRRYGHHDSPCSVLLDDKVCPCICGFEQALKGK
jgi:hypothetical protein